MQLAFKFRPRLNHKQNQIINELSWHLSKLYNTINYQIQNNDNLKPIYTHIEDRFKYNWHTDYLHSHNRQQMFKQLSKDWKSFFKSIKDYKNNSSKYNGRPRPPKFKYLDKNPNGIIFTKYAIRVKEGTLLLSLSREIKSKYNVDSLKFGLPPVVQSIIDEHNLSQIKIKKDNLQDEWYLLINYKVQEQEKPQSDNIMSIDLGLDNLATLTYKDNTDNHIINGKLLKSNNGYFNREISHLQTIRMKQTGSKHFKDTKQIEKLRLKRRNYVIDYIHKASKKVIDLAKKYDVSKIIIGDLKEIKQGMNYNKTFVQVPIQKFKKLIEYKAKLEGIEVIIINEGFTSGCSALDLEQLNRSDYDKSRRIERGLFISNEGIKINSDVNGSLNIMRKYLKDDCIPKLIQRARDNGVVDPPERIRVA